MTPHDTLRRDLEPEARAGHPGQHAGAGTSQVGGEAARGCVPRSDASGRGFTAGRGGSPRVRAAVRGKRERHLAVEPTCIRNLGGRSMDACLGIGRGRLVGARAAPSGIPVGGRPGSPLGSPARSGQFGGPGPAVCVHCLSSLYPSPCPAAVTHDPGTT